MKTRRAFDWTGVRRHVRGGLALCSQCSKETKSNFDWKGTKATFFSFFHLLLAQIGACGAKFSINWKISSFQNQVQEGQFSNYFPRAHITRQCIEAMGHLKKKPWQPSQAAAEHRFQLLKKFANQRSLVLKPVSWAFGAQLANQSPHQMHQECSTGQGSV